MLSLNLQPAEKKSDRADALDVVSVWGTVQGEGPFVGRPAVFVRLAGCNLTCSACFHGTTVIRMADFSTKLISEVRVGDEVLSYDEESGKFVRRAVMSVMSRQTRQVYRLDNGANTKTFVTGEHPVLVRGKGWVEVQDLREGDRILHLSLSELRRLHNPMKRPEVVAKNHYSGRDYVNVNRTEESIRRTAEITSHRMLTHNPMKNPAVAIKAFLNRHDRGKMTKCEEFVLAISSDLGLEFVGSGDLVVANKVPDFIVRGTNKLVEVWDETQTEFLGRDREWKKKRRDALRGEGYEVLFLPLFPYPLGPQVGSRKPRRAALREKEIKRVRLLISEFIRNGAMVKSVSKITPTSNPKAWTRLAGTLNSSLTVYNLEVEGTHTYVANTMVVHNCDTDYTAGRQILYPSEVMGWASRFPHSLMVITGGEPFRQDFSRLAHIALEKYDVQVETNGTLYQSNVPYEAITTVCSPKTPTIHPELFAQSDAFKYVVRDGEISEKDGLPIRTLGNNCGVARPRRNVPVYVQPLDEGDAERNKRNLDAAVKSCLRFGHILSVQMHKIAGLD